MGTVDTSKAASPEGTYCSAQTTPPLPPNRSSPPIITAERQNSSFIFSFTLIFTKTNKMLPAVINLRPAIKKGGTVSIANFIARYVDPQIIYTEVKAASSFKVEVFCFNYN